MSVGEEDVAALPTDMWCGAHGSRQQIKSDQIKSNQIKSTQTMMTIRSGGDASGSPMVFLVRIVHGFSK